MRLSMILLFGLMLILFGCGLSVDSDHYLKGMIHDTEGNPLSDASVYILFSDMIPNPPSGALSLPENTRNTEWYISITSAYLGVVRQETHIMSNTMVWNGTDDQGNPVCNGVYFCHLQGRDTESHEIVSHQKLNVLLENTDFTNRPATISSSYGYSLPMLKYFQFGTEISLSDENGHTYGTFPITGKFEICIKKDGYRVARTHVILNTYLTDHTEDFVLERNPDDSAPNTQH